MELQRLNKTVWGMYSGDMIGSFWPWSRWFLFGITYHLLLNRVAVVSREAQNSAGVEIGKSVMNQPGVVSAGPDGITGPLLFK